MKKIILVFTIISCILLCGCGKDNTSSVLYAGTNASRVHSKYFDAEILEEDTHYCIVRDKNTGYTYLIVNGYESSVMTRID